MSDDSDELGACELGTQEYWDERYKEEIRNYKQHGDVGEVWFGEDIVQRLLNWMSEHVTNRSAKIVDLGCGNGMLLIELFKENYTNLIGVDYSSDAIKLAKEIAAEQECEIKFVVMDILDPANNSELLDVDIILDKGTYDAISLNIDASANRKKYIENVHKVMTAESKLVITSCNWTGEELQQHFGTHFECTHVIPTPQFKFGGKVGNLVTSMVFKKMDKEVK